MSETQQLADLLARLLSRANECPVSYRSRGWQLDFQYAELLIKVFK